MTQMYERSCTARSISLTITLSWWSSERVPAASDVGQNHKANASTLRAKAWTFEAKIISPKAKAFKHTARAEDYAVRLTA